MAVVLLIIKNSFQPDNIENLLLKTPYFYTFLHILELAGICNLRYIQVDYVPAA